MDANPAARRPKGSTLVQLAGRGRLHSYATVHLHMGKDIEAPFTIGLIVLDDGPAIRSTLTNRTDAGLAIGDSHGERAGCGRHRSGRQRLVELRFARAEADK